MTLEERYAEIEARLNGCSDFPQEQQQTSRDLFQFDQGKIVPRHFDVWTVIAGLPVPAHVQAALSEISQKIVEIAPHARVYRVVPEKYHWEIFILKRPDEDVPAPQLQQARETLRTVVAETSPITISYRGIVLNADGTVLCKGFGDFEEVRRRLRERFPFASARQSPLGHISLLRILDPVGHETFQNLRAFVGQHADTVFGDMTVTEAKYMHETQWYMETCEVVEALPFRRERR